MYVNSSLPLAYEDLGAGGVVTIDADAGDDLLVAEGTAWADRACGVWGVIQLGNRLPLVPVGAETWRLAGGGGDDRV